MPKKTEIDHYSDKEALDFHIKGKSGKIEINSSKPLITKRDLSLAYSPGVAAPVKEIAKNPELAYDYTSKGNLVAVISNGSAILGLGNLGALASKPVMEGKSVLFKRFADIDSIDIEINNNNPESIIETKKNTKFAEILIRGSVVLVLPLKFHQDETIEIFKLFNLEEIMLLNLLIINEYFFYMIIIALLAWVLIHRSFIKINKQVLTEYVLIGFCLIYFH